MRNLLRLIFLALLAYCAHQESTEGQAHEYGVGRRGSTIGRPMGGFGGRSPVGFGGSQGRGFGGRSVGGFNGGRISAIGGRRGGRSSYVAGRYKGRSKFRAGRFGSQRGWGSKGNGWGQTYGWSNTWW